MIQFGNKEAASITIGGKEVQKIEIGGKTAYEKETIDYFYIENIGNGSNTLTLKATVSGSPSASDRISTLQYSSDKQTWSSINWTGSSQTETITIPVGGKVYMRNSNGKFSSYVSSPSVSSFSISMYCSDFFNAGGKLSTLLDYTGTNDSLKSGSFYNLFYTTNNTNKYKLKGVSNLKLHDSGLQIRCYENMFANTGITTPPSLPNIPLATACYAGMFEGCTFLTSTPSLSAKTLQNSCYAGMFEGCTSLTTPPSLPATKLANSCYENMFKGCTSLTTAPSLSVKTLKSYCYKSMFSGCTSLTTAPSLPATTLETNCYQEMFNGCTSLITPPSSLPATTLKSNCYGTMFQNCTSLTTAPTISATTLALACCMNMFRYCTSLTSTPELKATTLYSNCYREMFNGCSSLNSVTIYANSISATNCLENWLKDVSNSGTFYNNGSATYTTSSASGIPQGWTDNTSRRFIFSNTVITNVGNDQAQLTSGIQVNYKGTWDDGYFEVYNELDKDRSIHFSPSDISNGVLTASNLISESNVATLVSPATVTIYNSGTAVWTGSVSFTVVQ